MSKTELKSSTSHTQAPLKLEDLDGATLEALARKSDAKANFFAGRPNNQKEAQAAADEAKRIHAEIDKRAGRFSDVVDPEGTAPTLADGLGNFADDPEQANAGGIGIKDSNSQSPEATAQEIADLNAKLAAANAELEKLRAGQPGTGSAAPANTQQAPTAAVAAATAAKPSAAPAAPAKTTTTAPAKTTTTPAKGS